MSEVAKYFVVESLRNGRRIEIRALRPDDQAGLLAAISRTSTQSLFRRFFAAKRGFSEKEVAFFINIDFISHVALIALVEDEGGPVIVGGARYIVGQLGQAEVAFAVVDNYQGQGIGTSLMRHLSTTARNSGIRELIAEVLPDNIPMLKVFEKSGFRLTRRRMPDVIHLVLSLS